MIQLFFQVIAALALFGSSAVDAEQCAYEDSYVGASSGAPYSDSSTNVPGDIIKRITINGGDRVDSVAMTIARSGTVDFVRIHGGGGGNPSTVSFEKGECVTSMECDWGKHDHHTRVFFLKFTTANGSTVESGRPTKKARTFDAKPGYCLTGLHGFASRELDAVGPIWGMLGCVEDGQGTVAPYQPEGSDDSGGSDDSEDSEESDDSEDSED